MTEFELIRRFFSTPAGAAGVALGIGDDAALLEVPADHELVAATDTILAGVHFPTTTTAKAIGHRAVAVNLSDLAAMGAEPRWLMLALTLPAADDAWVRSFAEGFHALAAQHGCALVGGDTTRGPLAITVTALGVVPRGQALRRRGAKVGDALCVSGSLGDGAAGLRCVQGVHDPERADGRELVQRFQFPQPRVALGRALRGIATSCIDVSDGLAADLGHVLEASGVGARVDCDALPASQAFRSVVPAAQQPELMLSGGDDYELAFSCAPQRVAELAREAEQLGTRITRIGTIEQARGLRLVDGAGRPVALDRRGHDHFAA
jgi:thiamine-monophosphate kinase